MNVTAGKVQVWIYAMDSQGKLNVLLLKTNPARGSFWQPVTGSVEAGESLEDAASREAGEETGLHFEGAPVPLNYSFTFPSRWAPKNEEGEAGLVHEHAFSLRASLKNSAGSFNPPAVALDPAEHVDFQWLEPKKALSLLKFESNREALARLMKALHGKDLLQKS